jgi:hypothetical protein
MTTYLKPYHKHNIGSVSCGTMREEDLIPCFLRELESQRPLKRAHRKLIREIKRRMQAEDYYGSDDAGYDLNDELFDALNEYCLPYFYFGSHPGDSADYGYWLSEDFQEQFKDDGGLIVADTSDVPRNYSGEVLLVNDHGNMTLFTYSRGKSREEWAIV